MNTIFTFIIVASAVVLAFVSPQNFLSAMMDGAKESITVALTLFCIYAVWMGLASVAEQCGITKGIAKFLKPICRKFFKTCNDDACTAITMNLTCNFLGIGASTPYAVKAINLLEKDGNTYAQKLLFIINATGLQLLPTTVIALRTGAGSSNATDIFLPCIICSFIATVLGITLFLLSEKIRFKRKN